MYILNNDKYQATKILLLVLLLGFLTLLDIGYAKINSTEYYADIKITIQDTGETVISGTRNYPLLLENNTQIFTSKKGEYWIATFNFTEIFEVYTYHVIMPKNAIINYVHANVPLKISTDNDHTILQGSAEQEQLILIVQYSIPLNQNNPVEQNTVVPILVITIIGIIIISLFFAGMYGYANKKKTSLAQPWYTKKLLTDRQKQIINSIEKKEITTQRQLEKELEIPKSSLSRNIDALVRMDIIAKESNGITNTLRLNKEKPDIKIPK